VVVPSALLRTHCIIVSTRLSHNVLDVQGIRLRNQGCQSTLVFVVSLPALAEGHLSGVSAELLTQCERRRILGVCSANLNDV